MSHYAKPLFSFKGGKFKANLLMKLIMLVFSTFFAFPAYCQQPNKVQKAIDAIKATNNNEERDYITDGKRTVWVKSYKQWVPKDLVVMQKEAPDILKFLEQAIKRNRYDVLEELLPDYYRAHGGARAFADAVVRTNKKKAMASGT